MQKMKFYCCGEGKMIYLERLILFNKLHMDLK